MSRDPKIAWRFASLDKTCENNADTDAISAAARQLARRLIVEQESLAGRNVDENDIDIVSRDASGRGVRPSVWIDGQVMPWSLSISHTRSAALVALCTTSCVSIGVDLVRIEPLGPGFARIWFDEEERRSVGPDDTLETCRLWAVKEAVYKAVNRGESFVPRQVCVRRTSDGPFACDYQGVPMADRCRIDTWQTDDHVAAMAVLSDTINPCEPVGREACKS